MTPWMLSFFLGAVFPDSLSKVDLSSMNCFSYEVNAPLWADALSKGRQVCLPAGKTIRWKDTANFDYPVGTLLIKDFGSDGQLIETRLMLLTEQGWKMSGYRWLTSEGVNDAVRVDVSLHQNIVVHRGGTAQSQKWHFMAPEQCLYCHRGARNNVIGFVPEQISKEQIQNWNLKGWVQAHPSGNLDSIPRVPRYEDVSLSTVQRARAYLHANCSHCHSPGGVSLTLNLNYFVDLNSMNAIEQNPMMGNLRIPGAKIVKKGDPEKSVLFHRMKNTDSTRMPYYGSFMVDEQGIELVRDWIQSL